MVLARDIYKLTRGFPSEEKFGLVSQMRRAAVSIPSNIAEGQARKSKAEFVQFISTAEGSLAELDTQVQLSLDIGFSDPLQAERISDELAELKRMLNGLRRTLLRL
jgi:four helix bundle protein